MNQGKIRKPQSAEIEEIIRIWLDGNMHAHPFIQPDYWWNHVGYMREALPQAEVYIYEQDGNIAGFIGLQKCHIAGLIVKSKYSTNNFQKN